MLGIPQAAGRRFAACHNAGTTEIEGSPMQRRDCGLMPAFTIVGLAFPVLLSAGNWNVPRQARDLENPIERTTASLTAAQRVYDQHCVACHGREGAGDGTRAKVEYDLRSIVGALTDGEPYWKI